MTTLFISCCYQGGLFRLDTETSQIDQFGDSRPGTGLAHYNGRLAQVVGGDEVWIVSKYKHKILKKHKLTKTNNHYHDLKILGPKALLANTDRSRIDFYDTRTWTFQGHSLPLTPGALAVTDACHFNSICIEPTRGGIFGTAFALTDKQEGWREHKDRGLIFYLGPGRVIPIIQGFQQPHSIQVSGQHAWVCDSIPGNLVVMKRDPQGWSTIATWSIGKGFTRGFALGPDGNYYVGLSINRHPQVYGFDYEYDIKTAQVVQLNHEGVVLNRWDIPSSEIYDIIVDND